MSIATESASTAGQLNSLLTGGGTDATGYMWACWGANPGAEKQIVANRWDILSIEPHQRVKKS